MFDKYIYRPLKHNKKAHNVRLAAVWRRERHCLLNEGVAGIYYIYFQRHPRFTSLRSAFESQSLAGPLRRAEGKGDRTGANPSAFKHRLWARLILFCTTSLAAKKHLPAGYALRLRRGCILKHNKKRLHQCRRLPRLVPSLAMTGQH